MNCHHTPSRVSVNGYYICMNCKQPVKHKWYVNKYPLKRERPSEPETGIDRMTREADTDWLRQIGVSR